MEQKVPRLVLAGTNSGCGKTTVTCAVLQALVTRGLRVGAAKCGPDYIDPMFHSRVIGAKSSNLDSFFFDRDTMRYLLAHNGEGCDVTVIEGVMGYYDGLGLTSTRASTYEAARETESPVVLVVNARGAALSVLAAAEGFLRFAPDSGIRGVILNGCSAMSYGPLARELENRLGVRACGYLPRLPECALESRHLGLITADEVADLQEKLRKLAAEAEKTPGKQGEIHRSGRRAGRRREELSGTENKKGKQVGFRFPLNFTFLRRGAPFCRPVVVSFIAFEKRERQARKIRTSPFRSVLREAPVL